MDPARYAALFATESREQLAACGRALLEWERTPGGTEPVVALYRAMHTFKGMAGAMGYTRLAEMAHRTETVLDQFRSAPAEGTRYADLFFRVIDALERGSDRALAGQDNGLDFRGLLGQLDEVGSRPTGSWAPAPAGQGAASGGAGGGRMVRVTVNSAASMRGARAMLALRRAEALGSVSGLRPPLATFERDEFDGTFIFQLVSPAADGAVAAAIEAAGEVARVDIERVAAGSEFPAATERGRSVRVDLRRLDALMKQVGELVVARGRLLELVEREGSPEIEEVAVRIARVTADLHEGIVQARMTPVWQVFDRFPRVVRDLARQLKKRVRFEVDGQEIELDRTILDELGEPLIHLLRNALDHGIEPPAERARSGKSPEGVVRLVAERDRGAVEIRVSDDGAGIDRSRVRDKAVREGVLPPDTDALTDELLLRVLSRPGFSTAAAVSDVSGRGIGMDAVTARVRALGGLVMLTSTAGAGSTFTLRLPLTLAIVRALIARVGEERYAIPTAGVAETVPFHQSQVVRSDEGERLRVREELLPTVRLRDRLGIGGARPAGKVPAVIVEAGERRVAVVVDALVGQQEIVVEPFDAPPGTVPVFSGATILGDGMPTLILDPAALV
jgi:two-component system chemotaxis sensor kinase CheA